MTEDTNLFYDLNQLREQRVLSRFLRVSRSDIVHDGVILYGYGPYGKYIEAELLACGIQLSWIIDRDVMLHGSSETGVDIRPVSSLSEAGGHYILFGNTHVLTLVAECSRYGIEKWILPAALRSWCPLTCEIGICNDDKQYTEEIIAAHHLLADNKSRDVLMAFVRYHHTFFNDFSTLNDPIMYFPDDLRGRIDYSFFIDAGAYQGDTLQDWIREFNPANKKSKYYAFEPDASSFAKLQDIACALPEVVNPINAALGSKNGIITISGHGAGAHISEMTLPDGGGHTLHVKRIDDLFANDHPTIIKADVEGSEIALLSGAEYTIRRCRPALAISVYHKYSDIWVIPQWISKLDCGYEIYLRHHPTVFTDTVCYAIAK